jgi:hypothetical protein
MKIETAGDIIDRDVLVAGDALSFSFNFSTYPASLWSLQFALTLNGVKILQKDGTASGDTHTVALVHEDTKNLKCGKCQVWLVYTDRSTNTKRFSVDAGLLMVLPNPLGTLPPSPNALALAAIKRTIQTIVSQPEASASYNGQSYTMQNIGELHDLEHHLSVEVDNELRALGIPSKSGHKTIRTRFV